MDWIDTLLAMEHPESFWCAMPALITLASIGGGFYLLLGGPIASDIPYLNQALGLALMAGGPFVARKVS